MTENALPMMTTPLPSIPFPLRIMMMPHKRNTGYGMIVDMDDNRMDYIIYFCTS